MGEPEGMVKTAVRLPVSLRDRLHAESERRAIGVNLLAIRALEAFLDEREQEDV